MGFLLLLWWTILWFFLLFCVMSAVNELEVVNCTYGLSVLGSCDLFSRREKTDWLERLVNKIYTLM